jgi:hypothetical protein
VGQSVNIAFGPAEERIPESHLRKFVDDLHPEAPSLFIHHPGDSGVHLLKAAAAIAPSLAVEVLGLRGAVLRAITEGCPRAGRHCAWCEADLAASMEIHRRECPWLAIVNASSWLDGLQVPRESMAGAGRQRPGNPAKAIGE